MAETAARRDVPFSFDSKSQQSAGENLDFFKATKRQPTISEEKPSSIPSKWTQTISSFDELSDIQKERTKFRPQLPNCLAGQSLEVVASATVPLQDDMQRFLPRIYERSVFDLQPSFRERHPHLHEGSTHIASSTRAAVDQKPLKLGVVFCGRQSAGGHTIVASILDFLRLHHNHPDSCLYGFLGGTDGLINNNHLVLNEEIVNLYRNLGGYDMLGRTTDKIREKHELEATAKTCQTLQLHGLILIGGSITATDAAYLAEYLSNNVSDEPNAQKTSVIVVPCTIDGDLKNKFVETTIGFHSACRTFSHLIGNIAIDAESAAKYYYFIRLMGRAPSHITMECALQSHPNMVLIGEEVESRKSTLADIVSDICDMVAARAANGKNFGVILLSEGLISFVPEISLLVKELNEVLVKNKGILGRRRFSMADESSMHDIESQLTPWSLAIFRFLPATIRCQLLLEREPAGTLQLSRIDMERLLADLVSIELKKRKKAGTYNGSFSPITSFFGYAARSALPSNFDCSLAASLGFGAAALISHGKTGMMAVARNLTSPVSQWQIGGAPLTAMMIGSQITSLVDPRKADNGEVNAGRPYAIHSVKVDLYSSPYKLLRSESSRWAMEECYRDPGPIQFSGTSAMVPTITLLEEQKQVKEKLGTVEDLVDQIRSICRTGLTTELLDSAIVGLESLATILDTIRGRK